MSPGELERPRHHRRGAADQARRHHRHPLRTAGWPRCPPRTRPTGRWRSSAASSASCCRRSCAGSTRTTSTPQPSSGWPRRAPAPHRKRRRADMSDPEIETFPSPDALAAAVAGRLVMRLAAIQAAGRTPAIALTGGTIADKIHEAVVTATEGHEDVDWSQVDIWWGDERYVPHDDDERNARQAWDAMLSHLDVSPGRVHEMPASDGPYDSVQDAAPRRTATEVRGRHRRVRRGDARRRAGRPRGVAVPGLAAARRRRRDRRRGDRLPQAAAGAGQPDLLRAQPRPRGVVRGVGRGQGRGRRRGRSRPATTRPTCTTSRPSASTARTPPCGSSTRPPPRSGPQKMISPRLRRARRVWIASSRMSSASLSERRSFT